MKKGSLQQYFPILSDQCPDHNPAGTFEIRAKSARLPAILLKSGDTHNLGPGMVMKLRMHSIVGKLCQLICQLRLSDLYFCRSGQMCAPVGRPIFRRIGVYAWFPGWPLDAHRVLTYLGCLLLGGTVAFGATYQVGPGRSYTSLQQVVGSLNPGDIVEVDGDHTYAGGVTFTRPGTLANPIHIKGIRINGNRPILSGRTNTVAFTTSWPYSGPDGAHHYIFEGFEVTGGSNRGIFHQARNLTIRDCLVRDCPNQGILGADGGSGSLLLEYTEVTRCGSGDRNHQIYMSTDQENNPGSVFRMQHCYVHDANGGNNVKSRAERNEIYYNWIEGAYYHELELIGSEESDFGVAREDGDVVGNVLIKRATVAGNDPGFFVIRIGGDGTGESGGRYRFVNNTILSVRSDVFRMFDALESVEIQNNVFHTIDPDGTVAIHRTAEVDWVTGSAIISGSNNWIKTGALRVPPTLTGTIYGDDPGFMDPAGNDLRPATGSPLIDGGVLPTVPVPGHEIPNPLQTPLKMPPMAQIEVLGTAQDRPFVPNDQWDIGAYEVLATNLPPAFEAIGDRTTTAGAPVSIQVEASDPDDDPLEFSATGHD